MQERPVPPQRVRYGGRFEPLEEVGSGGMGAVYLVRDLETGEEVALKVLHERTGPNADRFSQESALLSELRHPAIVRYVAHGVHVTGERFLAMEWLKGYSLEERLSRGALSVLEAVALAKRMLDALATAHARGIVHRDLKPENLFLPDGHLARVKLLDFGIARRITDRHRITRAGATLGTPMYMAPEQARGQADTDHRADIFSLGCVIYECLTGRPPFVGDTAVAVLAKICLEPAVRPGKLRPDLPRSFEDIVTTMLAKDRDDRPSDTARLARMVENCERQLRAAGERLAEEEKVRTAVRTPSALSQAEQRLFSVGMLIAPRATAQEPVDRARAAVAAYGIKLDRFYNGSIVLTQTGDGNPLEQAVRGARAALVLQSMYPEGTLALCMTRTEGRETLPIGQVLERAGRLVMRAEPGRIELDESAGELLEAAFEIARTHDGGTTRLQLLHEKGLRPPPRVLFGRQLPLLGRDRELASLEAALDATIDEARARRPDMRARGRRKVTPCARVRRPRPGTWRIHPAFFHARPARTLRSAVRAPGDPRAPNRGPLGTRRSDVRHQGLQRVFAHALGGDGISSARTISDLDVLGELAGILLPDDDLPVVRSGSATLAPALTSAFSSWLKAELAAAPVVLIAEDLHQGDRHSVEVLGTLVDELAQWPLLVVATLRPEATATLGAALAARASETLALPPLTQKAGQRLVKDLLPDHTDAERAAIVARTEGNPLLLETLVHCVRDMRMPFSIEQLPNDLQAILNARLAALGPEGVRILGLCAVFGRGFPRAALESFWQRDHASEVAQWLAYLSERDLLAPWTLGARGEWRIQHALLRDAAYLALPMQERQRGHRLAAVWYEAHRSFELAVLAYHHEGAGDSERAAHYRARLALRG